MNSFENASPDFKRRNQHLFPDAGKKVQGLPVPQKLTLLEQPKPYDSEAERLVAESWIPRQQPIAWGYHELCILLPGSKYTPDFWMINSSGIFCVIEVKGIVTDRQGNKITHKSTRDARSKFRAARALWPWARFVWLEVEKGKVIEK